jgi:KaiC/GvpD/RAD55 family RecA-like ATPase
MKYHALIRGTHKVLIQSSGASLKDFTIQRACSGNPELDSFLSGGFPRGSLILISGNPGTGKTTLTASFLYGGSQGGENGIYASFSESKQSFYENMASMGLDFESLEKKGHFRFLEVFSATKQGMGEIAKYILEEIKQFKTKRLVIDSYSVMAQALGSQYEGRQLLHTFFSRIMRNMGCTTLVIGEQPTGEYRIGDTAEEFVADGVLNLKLTIPRELEIRKMRGTRLKTRNVLYTLDNGFNVVTTTLRTPEVKKKWQPIPDSGNLLSTGSPDFDMILGGGFPRGTYAVFEASADVTVAEVRLITRGLVLNFIAQKRGAMIVPPGGVDSRELKAAIGPYTTKEAFDNYLRIHEQVEADLARASVPPYVVPITYDEGAGSEKELSVSSDAFFSSYKQLKARTGNQPILRSIAYDTLESSYARFPDKLLNEVGVAMMRTKSAGDLTVGIGRPTVSILAKVLGMVDWHLKLSKIDGVLLVQGVKPYTNIYAADCDISKGYPVMTLKILT